MKKCLLFLCRLALKLLALSGTLLCLILLAQKIVAGGPGINYVASDIQEETVALTNTLDATEPSVAFESIESIASEEIVTSIDETDSHPESIEVCEIPVVSDIIYSDLFATDLISNAFYAREHGENYATILMCGDMLAGGYTHKVGRMDDGTYNYDCVFEPVTNIIQSADLALLNQEVILGGTGLGLSGYPLFNAAFELGDSEVKAGFDIILQASNHTIDQGKKGFDLCMNFWHTNHPEIPILGVNESEEEREEIYVTNVNGISIAILNYTYGTNGLAIPKDRPFMVNLLNEEEVIRDLDKARELADFVIVCPHWGTEYTLKQTSEQEKWAQIFADHGADLVLGTHPHVIEPVEWITGCNGNQTLVYYSLGNFNSNQARAETMLGIFATIRLKKSQGHVVIDQYGAIPIVTHYGSGDVSTYRLQDYTEEKAATNNIKAHDSKFSISYMYQLYEDVLGDLPQNVLE